MPVLARLFDNVFPSHSAMPRSRQSCETMLLRSAVSHSFSSICPTTSLSPQGITRDFDDTRFSHLTVQYKAQIHASKRISTKKDLIFLVCTIPVLWSSGHNGFTKASGAGRGGSGHGVPWDYYFFHGGRLSMVQGARHASGNRGGRYMYHAFLRWF